MFKELFVSSRILISSSVVVSAEVNKFVPENAADVSGIVNIYFSSEMSKKAYSI